MPTEAQTLAHMMDRTREYTLMYLNKLKDQDPYKVFECDGKPLNTMYWLVAHMAATQNGLLLFATGGPGERFSWAKHFMPGAPLQAADQLPPFADILATFNAVHTKAIAHLSTLSEEALNSPNPTAFTVFGPTLRDVITHAIRHEGSHIGHLGWLCKLYGIKTM